MKSVYPADLIRGAKAAKRISNIKIAEKKGMSSTTVSKISNGKTNIQLDSLIQVADELGYSVEITFKKTA